MGKKKKSVRIIEAEHGDDKDDLDQDDNLNFYGNKN
jgi:hypothetical protein